MILLLFKQVKSETYTYLKCLSTQNIMFKIRFKIISVLKLSKNTLKNCYSKFVFILFFFMQGSANFGLNFS